MRSSPNWELTPFKSPTACKRRIWARSSASESNICAPKRRFEPSCPRASRESTNLPRTFRTMSTSRASEKLDSRHERRSRLLVVSRQPNKAADPVATKLTELFRSLPKFLRRTITFDNGTEFAYHYRLHKLSMRTFFCDPHAPWQKGGIENAIGRMRRGLPRKTDLATLSNQRLLSLVRSYNHTPRKCLNYKTPAEVFCRDLLHFKCESHLPVFTGMTAKHRMTYSTHFSYTKLD